MTDLKVVLKQYQEAEQALDAAIRKNGDEFIRTLFQTIFDKYPTVTKLATIGSTPHFNDGDICEHSSEYFSGVWNIYSWRNDPSRKCYDYEDYSAAEEFFVGEDQDEDEEFTDEQGRTYAPVQAEEVEAVDENVANEEAKAAKAMMEEFDTIFERVYYTNYIVTAVRRADGTIEVDNDEYDVGY